jgi:transketolase N-terminal domain/subunit
MDDAALQRKAYEIRRNALSMIYAEGAGHVGGDMSAADILTVLFYEAMRCDASCPDWPERDRYVQSKGHCVEDEGIQMCVAEIFAHYGLTAERTAQIIRDRKKSA